MTLSRRGLVAAGALLVVAPAARARQRSDAELLEELLGLERRQLSAYEAALRRDAIEPGLGETLRDQERDHLQALERALAELGGGAPQAAVPPRGLGSALRGRREFAAYALGLEREATLAYADAASGIGRPGLRQPLGSIMTCEAAHQVALRAAGGAPLLAPPR